MLLSIQARIDGPRKYPLLVTNRPEAFHIAHIHAVIGEDLF
jgi:hypothetical protein